MKLPRRKNKQGQTLKETSITGRVWLIAEGVGGRVGARLRGGEGPLPFLFFLNCSVPPHPPQQQQIYRTPPPPLLCPIVGKHATSVVRRGGFQQGQMGLTVKTTADISVDLQLIIKQISRRFCQRIAPPCKKKKKKERDQPHSPPKKKYTGPTLDDIGCKTSAGTSDSDREDPPHLWLPATLTLMLMTFPPSLPPTRHNDAIRSVVFFLSFFFCCNSSHLVLLLPAAAAGEICHRHLSHP